MEVMYVIFGILTAPIIILVVFKMANDMNRR